MQILVTGGAGYIGSHTVVTLLEAGHDVAVVDNLTNSSREAVRRVEEITGRAVPLHVLDVLDEAALTDAVTQVHPDAVIHFAALKAVGESVAEPERYYRTNVGGTLNLVRAMDAARCSTIVFSSSATVYGAATAMPLTEDSPLGATNPYGWTKFMVEQVLRDVAAADQRWSAALLRYFNPVGAHPSGRIGEDPRGTPNNLVPYIAQVAVGRRRELTIFGDDFDTPDGTGMRDYIHVVDLAEGHLAALEHLVASSGAGAGAGARAWNLGTGRASSVREVVAAFAEASEREIPVAVAARRAGDVAVSYADPTRAREELGWSAGRDLATMCTDTWRWQEANPQGYAAS